jgi:phospholipase/lecithinase/hemolysin
MPMNPISCRRVLAAALVAAAMAATLASCGGGTSQIEPFRPQQVIVLGDDSNLLTTDGKRYGVNGLDANNALACGALPVWTQQLAANFGISLDRCPSGITPLGVTRAAFGAKAADLDAQIDAQFAAGAVTSKDLFVLMIGMNDVIERYEAGAACGDSELASRGRHVAQQINRIIDAGGRIIVSTVPDLGFTPYARTRDAASPGQAALLTCLTATYNARVRVDIVQDGRFVGLVLADDLVTAMTRNPANYALSNVTDAACTAAVPDCTTATLVTGATAATHLWADDRRFGPTAHVSLGNLAIARARNNPF